MSDSPLERELHAHLVLHEAAARVNADADLNDDRPPLPGMDIQHPSPPLETDTNGGPGHVHTNGEGTSR
jgi:hypothetical protein